LYELQNYENQTHLSLLEILYQTLLNNKSLVSKGRFIMYNFWSLFLSFVIRLMPSLIILRLGAFYFYFFLSEFLLLLMFDFVIFQVLVDWTDFEPSTWWSSSRSRSPSCPEAATEGAEPSWPSRQLRGEKERSRKITDLCCNIY